ncbi:MAG: hypothetical protein JST85_24075 [Acidobacteria bacterium]|nr:hypothetical protein [Acidobacteriota bacterium]
MIAVSSAPLITTNSRILVGTLARPSLDVQTGRAELTFPGFNYSISAFVESHVTTNPSRSVLKVYLDEGITLECEFLEKVVNGNQKILLEGKSELKVVSSQPRAHFIANTLESLFLLDSNARLKIPGLQLEIGITFAESLTMIGQYLQRRQTVFQLMTIEKRLNQSFSIPHRISDLERKDIAFAYHAVTCGTFDWPFRQGEFPCWATPEIKRQLTTIDGIEPIEITIDRYECFVLDKRIVLDEALIKIENPFIANLEKVSHELQSLDGHEFLVSIGSLTGRATYEFSDISFLNSIDWDERTTELVNLEDKLDERFFELGNHLAAATLDDLTEQEKAAITESFILNAEAFTDPATLGE